MSKQSDYYPVGMHECDRLGLNGQCGEDCPLLASEEYVRYEENCYPYREYLIVKNKSHMSAIKHLRIDEE